MSARQEHRYTYESIDNGSVSLELTRFSGKDDTNERAFNADSKDDLSSQISPGPLRSTPTRQYAATKRERFKILRFNGWRVGITWCTIATTIVLIMNITWTISVAEKDRTKGGRATIFDGNCTQTRSLTLGLHLAINILGTILLAASNYCMQCLASPTREEIDRAHSRSRCLDIGVQSLRNIFGFGIRKERRFFWLLLASSSIPLHLLFNSAVFSTLSVNTYTVNAISEDLATNTSGDVRKEIVDGIRHDYPVLNYAKLPYDEATLDALVGFRSWQRLDNLRCMEVYGTDFLSDRGHVMLVTSNLNNSQAFKAIDTRARSPYWMCANYFNTTMTDSDSCDVDKLRQYASTWTVIFDALPVNGSVNEDMRVEYCLSQQKEGHCTIQVDINIMIVVIVANAVKVVAMVSTLWIQRHDPLVTLGDAIKSFLDSTTSSRCLAVKKAFPRGRWQSSSTKWHFHRPFWSHGVGTWEWWICNVL